MRKLLRIFVTVVSSLPNIYEVMPAGLSFRQFMKKKKTHTHTKPIAANATTAVCLVGAYRTFSSDFVRKNFESTFRQASFDPYHLFVNIQLEARLKSKLGNMTKANISGIISDLDDLDRRVFSEYKLKISNETSGCRMKQSIYSQFSKISDCYNSMVLRREYDLGLRYKYVIRTRTDLVYITPIPFLSTLSSSGGVHVSTYHRELSDHFWISPRSISDHVFNMTFWFCEEGKESVKNRTKQAFGAERLLQDYWNAQSVNILKENHIIAVYDHNRKLMCNRLEDWPSAYQKCSEMQPN